MDKGEDPRPDADDKPFPVDAPVDAAPVFVEPQCFAYGIGGPDASFPASALAIANGNLFWSTSKDTLANQVHTIATDFTGYRAFTNQVNVTGIAVNANGAFWGSKALDATAGLYRLPTVSGTPTLVTAQNFIGAIAATDNDIVYQVVSNGSSTHYRVDGLGANPTYWSSLGLVDQFEVVGTTLYWGQTTIHPMAAACASGSLSKVVQSTTIATASPSAFAVALDGCKMLTASGRAMDSISQFAVGDGHVWATGNSGSIYHQRPDGTVEEAFHPLVQGGAAGIARVGNEVVFSEGGNNADEWGIYRAPLDGSAPPTRFVKLPYGFRFVADATAVYFVSHQHVCKITLP